MKQTIFVIALLFLSLIVKSQDTLLLKDGQKILCKIKGQDSTSYFFEVEKNDKVISSYIYKDKVQEIRYYNPDYTRNLVRKHMLELSGGLSFPIGDYAKANTDDENSGFAGKGYNINIVYSYALFKKAGFSVKANFTNNFFKAKELFNDFSTSSSSVFSKNYYTEFGLLAGPNVSLTFKKFTIKGSFLVGYSYLSQPVVSCAYFQSGTYYKISLKDDNAQSVIFNPGLSLKYRLTDEADLLFDVEAITGSYNFGKGSVVTSYAGSDNIYDSYEFERGTQKYSVVNISLGINARF
jgi:hypothetical protein